MAVGGDRRERCDGCGSTVVLEELTTVTMPDGERLACCGSCEPHAREAARKLDALEEGHRACDGCTDAFHRSELEDVVLADGTVVSCCPACLPAARRQRETDASTPDASEANSTKLATPRTLCSQCHEWATEELFHVTTIDGRTEEMCTACKEAAERREVVNDVKMRRAEAREVLRVDADATDGEIRQAFLTQIKHAHPDKKSGSTSAFTLVKEAYDRLR